MISDSLTKSNKKIRPGASPGLRNSGVIVLLTIALHFKGVVPVVSLVSDVETRPFKKRFTVQ
ncbi:protein of unknown function [Mesotoga infera]|uniref:Uncharacterized protein n=1 Tax=Mesotoga infera TaxID=1236046 RepID=A0A7Z7PP49_9BACT|nr:protein of unknown function [Mesotoga infera]